jgi:hypothetical protein
MNTPDALLAQINLWRDTLLIYAVLLGVEAVALLWLAVSSGRRWPQWLFALAPAAGNGFVLRVARDLTNLSAGWHAYLFFQVTHYAPAYLPAFTAENVRELQDVVPSVATRGWACTALTAALLTFGWALLLRWRPRSKPALGAPMPSPAPASAPATAEAIAAAQSPSDDEAGELEITVEPLEPE